MLGRLSYRIQIPLGLSLAVVIAALLVTVVAAQNSVRSARNEALATVDRTVELLAAQARPLLAADDIWRVFTLLRNTAALLPGAELGKARAAILDAEGRVFAASDPVRLETGNALLGATWRGQTLPAAKELGIRPLRADHQGSLTLVDPIRSEDGQVQGFVHIEVDATAFTPNWAELAKPALIGVGLAAALLVPAGWWFGRRMTRPVVRVAQVIERIGRTDPKQLLSEVPRTADPELGLIGNAVERLISEMQVRRQAEQRALSAERMAAVGRLTAAVAHEINNPIAGLLTAAQTLRLHGETADTRIQTVELIERGLQQIRTTVAALVPQARIEDRPFEINDFADVVTLVLPVANRLAIDVRSRTEVLSAFRVPSAMLRQVMLNLLLNAVGAAGEKGTVEISLKVDAQAVRFVVANSGERLTARKFEQRLAAEGGDDPQGFGLWVCREIATQYEGGFSASEADSAGTHLTFWIPNREQSAHAAIN